MATISVGPSGNYTSIQVAINAAATGDEIIVASGIYNENITINKAVTLKGPNVGVDPTTPDIDLVNGIDTNTGYRTNTEAWIKGTITVAADNVTIDGFRLRNIDGPLQWQGAPQNFKLLNNYLTGYDADKAPKFGDANANNPTDVATGWDISGNYIGGLLGGGGAGGALYLAGLTDSKINNNTFWRPRAAHLYLASLTNVDIEGNNFYHGLHAGGADYDGYGQYFSGSGYGYGDGYGRNYWFELKGTNNTVNVKNNTGKFNSGGIQLYSEAGAASPFKFDNITIENNTFPVENFINAYTEAPTNGLSGLIPAVMATAATGGATGSNLVIRNNTVSIDLSEVKYGTDHTSSLEVRGNFEGVTVDSNNVGPTGTNGGVSLITGLSLLGGLSGDVAINANQFLGTNGSPGTAAYYGIDFIPNPALLPSAINDYGTFAGNLVIAPANDTSDGNTFNGWQVGVVLRNADTVTSNAIDIQGNTFTNNERNVFDGINPDITLNSISYNENSSPGSVLGTVTATDNLTQTDNVGVIKYEITSENDSGFFSIDASTGEITLTQIGLASVANDFEATPNAFTVTVKITDAGGLTAEEQVTLNVLDVTEVGNAPVISSPGTFAIPENTVAVGTVVATDDDNDPLTYSLSGGVDQSFFTIDSSSGALAFKTAPDFENPQDQGRDNVYNVQVQVTDESNIVTQDIKVTVLDQSVTLLIRNPNDVPTQQRFEGNSGSTPYTFEIVREGEISSPLTVFWQTEGRQVVTGDSASAADASDFAGGSFPSGTVTFTPETSLASLTVNVQGDTLVESDEGFRVRLLNTNPDVILTQSFANALITNDDGRRFTWTFGDPHLVTLDGLAYDFMAVGEFVLLETTPGSDAPFQVQVRYEPFPGSEVASVATRMAVQLGARKVELQLGNDPLLIDGAAVPITDGGSLDLNGDGVADIQRSGNQYTVTISALGEQVQVSIFDSFMDVSASVLEPQSGSSRNFQGLLGNLNNDTADDLTDRDGNQVSQSPIDFTQLYGSYADSWRVEAAGTSGSTKQTLFTYGQGQGVGSFDNPGFPKGIIDPTQFPADLYQAAEAAVASIADPILRQSALYDLLLTGDQSFVTSAANTSTTPQSESNDFGQTAPQLTSVGVSVLPISIVEGDTNSQDVTFTFWRTDGSSSLTMFYQLEGMVDAGDVEIGTPFSGSVAFADGETEKQVVVKVLGDEAIETDETLTASLVTTNLGSFLIASGKATTTIVNDDFPPLTINTIAGDDIINRSERAAGTAITGSIAGGSGIVEVQVTIGTGTQPPSKTGTVDSDGNWSINFTEQDLTPLGDGSFTVTAVGTTSGNVQTDPASRAILIDATAPGFPTINPVTGDNNIDATEKATGVEITGTAEANSTVRLKFGDAIRNLTAINGSWSAFIQPDELPNVETVTLTITATDAAGNQSNPATQAVTVAVINDITIDLEGDDYFIILTSGPPVSLKLENQQFTKTAAGDWEDLEAETINGQNQVLWRNSVTQQIGIWTTDDDWNYQSATVNPIESLQTLEAEVDFQVDINGDGILGDVREFVDTQGSTQLLKGIYGFYYVQTVDDIDNSVKYLGEPFNNYGYWQASAAEVIGDANQVLWKNSFTRQIGIWTTDDNWNYVSADVDPIRSLQTLKAEVDFQVDLNGDTKLGDHQVVIDEAGSVKLWQGIYGFYHVETETTDGLTSVKYQNEGFNDYGSWQALSAEVVDGLNQVLWQNLDTEEIGIWTTDDSWNYVSAAVSPIASDQTLKAEFDFQVDLNGDGIMSYTPTA